MNVDLFFVLFLVFYLLYGFQSIREQLVEVIPSANRALAREITARVDSNAGNFIRAYPRLAGPAPGAGRICDHPSPRQGSA